MSEFVKKGNKYYRNNSNGTQTQVTPTQDGYFTWVQPDGKRVRSQKRYQIDTSEPKKEPSIWERMKAGFIMGGNSDPGSSAIQTASGFSLNSDGSLGYNTESKGARQTRKALAAVGATGAAGYGGVAALSYVPAIVPELTVGQLPWWQTTIGTAAGSMATGMTADEVSKATTGKTIGGNIKNAVSSLGSAGRMYADIIPDMVWDFGNPFYAVNPQSIVKGFSPKSLQHARLNIPNINDRTIWHNWGDESLVRVGENYVDKVSKQASKTKFGLGFAVRRKLEANNIPAHVPYEYKGYVKGKQGYYPVYRQQKVEIDRASGIKNIKDITKTLQNNGYTTSVIIDPNDGSYVLQANNGTFNIFDIYSDHNVGTLGENGVMYDAKIGQGVKYPIFWLKNNFNLFPNGVNTNFQSYPTSVIIGSEINSNN